MGRFAITISNSPPEHSTSNGQVERFHSTLAEIATCLKEERKIINTSELILLATIEYNKTIHSVINEKPKEALFVPELRNGIASRIKTAERKVLIRNNKGRSNRLFNVGDTVFVKRNKRRGNKLSIRFVKGRVAADLGTTLLVGNKIVHKDNVR